MLWWHINIHGPRFVQENKRCPRDRGVFNEISQCARGMMDPRFCYIAFSTLNNYDIQVQTTSASRRHISNLTLYNNLKIETVSVTVEICHGKFLQITN